MHAFNEMLDRLEAERRESSRRALAAQEAERCEIARGLHDEVGQVLTGVLLQLDALASADGQAAPASRRRRQPSGSALEEVRRIAQELRPELLEHLGLVERADRALAHVRATRAASSSSAASPSTSRRSPTRPSSRSTGSTQESLTNIARHAQASRVELALEPGADSVVLRIVDNGRGMAEAAAPNGSGGLRGMRERAVLVGGALAVKPGRDGGVEVRLEVPAETA